MLSLVLPTHCEAAIIGETLRRVTTCLEGLDYEILVVDDGSTDDTPALVQAYAERDRHVRLICTLHKSGTALAIQAGVEAARGDAIATMNADLQHPPELVPAMLERIHQGCDVVIASRYVAGGDPGMSAIRTLVSRSAILLAGLLFPRLRAVRDPLAGYFMFSRSVTADVQLLPRSSSGRVSIGLKFLLGMLVLGYVGEVREIPCHMRRRRTGRSKFSAWDVAAFVRYLGFLLSKSGEAARLFTFCLVGASAFLVYGGTLFLLTNSVGFPYPASAAVGWGLAFIWSFVINDRLTFGGARRQTSSNLATRGARYLAVKLSGLVLHLLVLAALTELAGIHYLVSAVMAVALVVVWNYAASRELVWSSRNRRQTHQKSEWTCTL